MGKIVEATRAKIDNANAIRKRIAMLQSIAGLEKDETTPVERMKMLKDTVQGFQSAGDETLADDPLFRIVNDLSARYLQVSKAPA